MMSLAMTNAVETKLTNGKKILLIDDDDALRDSLSEQLALHEEFVTTEATSAADALEVTKTEYFDAILLDVGLPDMDGRYLCRLLRRNGVKSPIIMLTGHDTDADQILGLDAGANDYITKPFRRRELAARIGVGERVVELQQQLAQRVTELEEALSKVKTLQGLLPICSYCKKIRGDNNYWKQVEGYIEDHADVSFSHGICPDCYSSIVEPQLAELEAQLPQNRRKDTT